MTQLYSLRREVGMSRKQLGTKIGVSIRSVAAYETGERRPSPTVAARIGQVFGLSTQEIWNMFYSSESA